MAAATVPMDENRVSICREALEEVLALADVIQLKGVEGGDGLLWARGVGARLEELANIALSGFDADMCTIQEARKTVYGPAWARQMAETS